MTFAFIFTLEQPKAKAPRVMAFLKKNSFNIRTYDGALFFLSFSRRIFSFLYFCISVYFIHTISAYISTKDMRWVCYQTLLI